MFVLHFLDRDGTPVPPIGGDDAPTIRHSTTARKRAREQAAFSSTRVQVSRVIDGELRPAYIVRPDGSSEAPSGMKVPAREQHRDDGPCFCTACRADRAEARKAR